MILINILAFIFMLGLVIFIHELGHFIMAKRAGILCHEFALGFGPIVYSKRKGETLYSIRLLPLGGFVSMAGEEVSDELVKVSQRVKLVFDQDDRVDKIVVDPAIPGYDDAQEVLIDYIDLKGVDGGDLTINGYPVNRDAHYVFRNKTLQIAPYDRSFESKTLLERFLTIFAGPFMNFVLALVIFFLVSSIIVGVPRYDSSVIGSVGQGMPAEEHLEAGDKILAVNGTSVSRWDEISALMRDANQDLTVTFEIERDGSVMTVEMVPMLSFFNAGFSADTDADAPVVGSVGENSPADQAGLQAGDELVAIGQTAVNNWSDVINAIEARREGGETTFTVLRDGETETLTIGLFSERFLSGQGVNFIHVQTGIGPEYTRAFFAAFPDALANLTGTFTMIFSTLRALFAEAQVGVGDLAGPVGIFSITSQFVSAGLASFLTWMAILSVNLGIINLLPIPALDGGRIVFLGYEAIVGKPVKKEVENSLHFIMFILLMALILFITYNDILRL